MLPLPVMSHSRRGEKGERDEFGRESGGAGFTFKPRNRGLKVEEFVTCVRFIQTRFESQFKLPACQLVLMRILSSFDLRLLYFFFVVFFY